MGQITDPVGERIAALQETINPPVVAIMTDPVGAALDAMDAIAHPAILQNLADPIEARLAALEAGGGSYHADAIHLDGLTALGLTDQAVALAADAPTGVMSVWVNGANFFNTGAGGFPGLLSDNNSFNTYISGDGGDATSNILNFGFKDAADANAFTAQVLSPFSSGWVNLLLAWNMNFPAGSRILQVCYSDVVQSVTVGGGFGGAFDMNYSDSGWQIASANANGSAPPYPTGDMADFQLWCGTFVDLTVSANRRLFIDANGKPVDPAAAAVALGPQTVRMSGNAASFATNQGAGGSTSVLSGSLTNASSSPSD